MIVMGTDTLREIMDDAATYPYAIDGDEIKFYDEADDAEPLHTIKLHESYADEDLECALEDMAYWVAQNLDKAPLIFRNLKIQEKFYKLVEEYKDV